MDITHESGETESKTFDETLNPITITITMPDDLANADGDTYKVLRVHAGAAEEVSCTDNGDGTLSFSSDKFSTYGAASTSASDSDDGNGNDGNTGSGNDGNDGDGDTGSGNDGNSGYGNTGYGNTGSGTTGSGTTGEGGEGTGSVKTADTSTPFLYLFLMIASFAAVVVVLTRRFARR